MQVSGTSINGLRLGAGSGNAMYIQLQWRGQGKILTFLLIMHFATDKNLEM